MNIKKSQRKERDQKDNRGRERERLSVSILISTYLVETDDRREKAREEGGRADR